MLQRIATWNAGAVHEVNNLAISLLYGSPVGVTWPTLNGSTFWMIADARRLLSKPTLAFACAAGGGVDASVATVPRNIGSFDETVLSAGPWTTITLKTNVGGDTRPWQRARLVEEVSSAAYSPNFVQSACQPTLLCSQQIDGMKIVTRRIIAPLSMVPLYPGTRN
jgi:hypothetical protein